MNVGKMLDRSIGRFSLDDLFHGFHESVNHNVKPILDRLGHFRLSELIKHIKNKPILSHVVGDERPTTIEVVVHKPNGHHETIFSIPHKKLHKFHKPQEEEHHEHHDEEEVENVDLGHETEVELKPVIDYTSQVYTTTYKKPGDHQGRGVADTQDFSFEDFEDPIYKPLKRDRRDVNDFHYPDEFEGEPVKGESLIPEKNTRPNEVFTPGKGTENFEAGQAGGVRPNKGGLSGQGAVSEKPSPDNGASEHFQQESFNLQTSSGSSASSESSENLGSVGSSSNLGSAGSFVQGVAATVTKRPSKPEKFVVTIEEHPETTSEVLTFGPDKDPNVEYQEEFTAQELLQFVYKWLRKNVVFRV